MASPNAACPGLLWKPMDAGIGRLLALYCPSGRQGNRQTNKINKYTYKAGRFDGHGDAPVRNRAHRLMEEVLSFTISHWMPPLGKYYAQ
jgi:hypothetical protein